MEWQPFRTVVICPLRVDQLSTSRIVNKSKVAHWMYSAEIAHLYIASEKSRTTKSCRMLKSHRKAIETERPVYDYAIQRYTVNFDAR